MGPMFDWKVCADPAGLVLIDSLGMGEEEAVAGTARAGWRRVVNVVLLWDDIVCLAVAPMRDRGDERRCEAQLNEYFPTKAQAAIPTAHPKHHRVALHQALFLKQEKTTSIRQVRSSFFWCVSHAKIDSA